MDAQHPAYAPPAGAAREMFAPVLSIKQLAVMLWAHRRMIAAVTVVFAVVGALLLVFVLPPVYQATATLLVAYKTDDPVSGEAMTENYGWNVIGTQVELLRSSSTLLPVVDQLRLVERRDYVAGYGGDGSPDSLRQYAAGVLGKRLKITPGEASRFIYVSVEDHDPVMAATLANAIVDTYLQEQIRHLVEPAKDRIQRYSGQLEVLRRNVEAAQAKVSAFRKKTGLIDLRETADLDSTQLNDLSLRLTQARAARQEAELRLVRAGQADPGVLDSTLVQSLKAQLQQKEAQLSELQGSLGPRHPQIVSLRAEMAQLDAQLAREIGVHVESARAALDAARAIEGRLQAQLDAQRQKVMLTRTQQDEGSSLLQELDSAAKVYRNALDAFERAQLGTQMAASNVTLASRAAPPSMPRGGRRQTLVMIVVLGFVLSAVGSLLFEFMNRRVRCREDLEHDLGLPVLIELRTAG